MSFLIRLMREARHYYQYRRIEYHKRNILSQVKGGEQLYLEGLTTIINPEKLVLGKNVYIGTNAYINCRGNVKIGDHTIISRRVTIYSYDHNFKYPRQLPYDIEDIIKPVDIGKYVWIGMNVTIVPGTVIGDGAVIGMGAVVSGNIPENAIVVSAKTRIVGYRDPVLTKHLVDQDAFLNKRHNY